MNINDVDLNLLKVFDAIYAERSVSRAALRLGLTQPTVSNGLKRLRAVCADTLFIRARAGVAPTPAAERLAPSIQAALRGVQEALDATSRFEAQRSRRRFTLHMSDFGEVVFLPPLLAALGERAAGVSVETRQIDWRLLPDVLESGQIDLAVGYLPTLDARFQSRLLFDEEYVELARAPGRGARRDWPADFAAVTSHPPIQQLLADAGLTDRVRLAVPHFMVLPAILEKADLKVILPSMVAAAFGRLGRYRTRPLPGLRQSFAVSVFWTRRGASDPGIAWLRELLVELLAQGPPQGALRVR